MQESQKNVSALGITCTKISGSDMESEGSGAGNERAGDKKM